MSGHFFLRWGGKPKEGSCGLYLLSVSKQRLGPLGHCAPRLLTSISCSLILLVVMNGLSSALFYWIFRILLFLKALNDDTPNALRDDDRCVGQNI